MPIIAYGRSLPSLFMIFGVFLPLDKRIKGKKRVNAVTQAIIAIAYHT
jgi:hypothetical protein